LATDGAGIEAITKGAFFGGFGLRKWWGKQ
jgi:hypothetical protein